MRISIDRFAHLRIEGLRCHCYTKIRMLWQIHGNRQMFHMWLSRFGLHDGTYACPAGPAPLFPAMVREKAQLFPIIPGFMFKRAINLMQASTAVTTAPPASHIIYHIYVRCIFSGTGKEAAGERRSYKRPRVRLSVCVCLETLRTWRRSMEG